jgi:predicted RNase H-like HicB family nuclease
MSSERYPVNIFWSEDDAGFIALAPDLPGCSAFGETRDEALNEVRDAIEAWIGAARAAGNPIPAPSAPQPDYTHSGRVLVRMPKALHAQLVERAKVEAVSLNSWMVFVLTKGMVEANTNIGRIQNLLARMPSSEIERAVSSAFYSIVINNRTTHSSKTGVSTSQLRVMPANESLLVRKTTEFKTSIYDPYNSLASEN